MYTLLIFNLVLLALFLICYSYQIVYIIASLFAKKKAHKETTLHRYAVLICAHNEENVIGGLLDSIAKQDYPKELYDVYVGADNCTDGTADLCRSLGATVYERHDTEHIGKGYVLEFLLGKLVADKGEGYYDGYVVFDADNLASPQFITEVNKTRCDGFEIVTGYRNSKNYGAGWRAAGSGLWFIHESAHLNKARSAFGSGCFLAGTGFMFTETIRRHNGGWPFHMLTEDCEFVFKMAIDGYFAGYAPDAMFYDEQTPDRVAAFHQKLRWCRGGLQVCGAYFGRFMRKIFSRHPLTYYDLSMSAAPAYLFTSLGFVVDTALFIYSCFIGEALGALAVIGGTLVFLAVFLYFFGLSATLSEWKRIKAPAGKKILYTFTFPLFMFTFAAIAFIALFVKVEWKPIKHTSTTAIEEMNDTDENGKTDK